MSRSLGGIYTLPPGSAAVDNTIIDPVIYNALLADLEADLNIPRPIVAGGTGAASADGALTELGGTTTGKAVFTAASVAAALVALGLTNAQVPPGQVGHFFTASAPAGWLWANGANVSRTTYATLWAAMGSPNTGDGSTTFTLPDLRGEFLRGWDNGRGVDAGRVLGSAQAAAMLDHTHSGNTGGHSADHSHTGYTGGTGGLNGSIYGISEGFWSQGATDGVFSKAADRNVFSPTGGDQSQGGRATFDGNFHTHAVQTYGSSNNHTHAFTSGNPSAGGGAETRPRNVALLVCIKT